MATVVVGGPANSAPGLLVGPSGAGEDAADWVADQLAEPGRYMVAAELRSAQDVAG